MKKLKVIGIGLLSVSLLGLTPLAANAETPAVTDQVDDGSTWVGGVNPDFDIEAHRGEEIRIGTSWEDGVTVGHIPTSEEADEPQVGVMSEPAGGPHAGFWSCRGCRLAIISL